jgi:hypothetical protein
MQSNALMTGVQEAGDYIGAVALTALLSALCLAVSIPIMNKKQL